MVDARVDWEFHEPLRPEGLVLCQTLDLGFDRALGPYFNFRIGHEPTRMV
jgi:hypothetical protein